MTASEFAFLALGLLLGVATGAALIDVVRARPPAPREVRLTVTPDSVPRRASTLATAGSLAAIGPAPGGPGDRRDSDRDGSPGPPVGVMAAQGRTDVPSPTVADRRSLVGIAIEPELDRVYAALRARPVAAGVPEAGATLTALQDDGSLRSASSADGSPDAGVPDQSGAGGATDSAPTALETLSDPEAGPCAEARRLAVERCAVADRLAAQAEAAAVSLRKAQRAYDDHESRAARAAEAADPRALRNAKEAAQHEFRQSSARAGSRDAVEAAARAWLQEINRINQIAREATLTRRREQDAVNALVTVIERLSVEADAARISAESASEACLNARQAVATCEEEAVRGATASAPHATAPLTAPDAGPAGTTERPAEAGAPVEAGELAAAATFGEGGPVLFGLLRGDRATLQRAVSRLAGDDPAERRHWQLQLTDLVDAIVARAIEASALDFPTDHPFWAPFTREQSRDIVTALASLGYRFDGLGGFSDERFPSQRDLSLAVGFAGLDPMRIRHWPPEAEMPELLRDVSVAADEYVAATAGSLTLGEMVSMLGRRADGLSDLWNAWGRIRPLLLAAD